MSKKVSVLNRNPVYQTLQNELRKRVHRGDWRRGALIPSRRALADEFQVSVPTVQKAITDMVSEGLLRVNAKRGTYVFGEPEEIAPPTETAAHLTKHRSPSEQSLRMRARGHVALIADVSPSESLDLASTWPYVVMNEAEHTLAKLQIPSRFYNRFDTSRREEPLRLNWSDSDKIEHSQTLLESVLDDKPSAVILHESVLAWPDISFVHMAVSSGVVPIVVGSHNFGPECVSISYDHGNAGFQAAQHLIDCGCQRLLFFSGYHADWVDQRLTGVQMAMKRRGVALDELTVTIGTEEVENLVLDSDEAHVHISIGYASACKMLESGLHADGVIAINDDAAFGFIRAASERGYVVGKDYAIIGFDDTPDSLIEGLTTMHPPCVCMGREAARAVARFLQGETDLVSVMLKSRLVIRPSSCLPR